jgi:hypothetical protein
MKGKKSVPSLAGYPAKGKDGESRDLELNPNLTKQKLISKSNSKFY